MSKAAVPKQSDNIMSLNALSGPFRDLRLILEYGRESAKEAALGTLTTLARLVKYDNPDLSQTERQAEDRHPSEAHGKREIAQVGLLRDLQEILQSDDPKAKESVRLTIERVAESVRNLKRIRKHDPNYIDH